MKMPTFPSYPGLNFNYPGGGRATGGSNWSIDPIGGGAATGMGGNMGGAGFAGSTGAIPTLNTGGRMGTQPTNWSAAYGGIPQIPNPDLGIESAVSGNMANLAGIYGLTGDVNSYNQGQADLGLRTNLPGYADMRGQQSDVIGQELKGMVPQDVMNQIWSGGAERGVAMGGAPDSPNTNAAALRAMGLTSMGQQQTGMANLNRAIGQTPVAQNMQAQSMFLSPEDYNAANVMQSVYNSAPIPSAAAAASEAAAMRGLDYGYGKVAPWSPVTTGQIPTQKPMDYNSMFATPNRQGAGNVSPTRGWGTRTNYGGQGGAPAPGMPPMNTRPTVRGQQPQGGQSQWQNDTRGFYFDRNTGWYVDQYGYTDPTTGQWVDANSTDWNLADYNNQMMADPAGYQYTPQGGYSDQYSYTDPYTGQFVDANSTDWNQTAYSDATNYDW